MTASPKKPQQPTTAADLLSLAGGCAAVTQSEVQEYRSITGTAAELAALLVRDGVLTQFQAEHLLRGRPHALLLGGRYQLLSQIGAGGMGTVYLARHIRMNRLVAIKVLPSDRLGSAEDVARFEREAQAAAALSHEHVVRAHDFDAIGSMHYLVMEFVDGAGFDRILAVRGRLSVERACEYARQAALGLQHAAERGLVHRDVKPANLLVTRGGMVKVLDLGLARPTESADGTLTRKYGREDAVQGTADYISPEQARGEPGIDSRADIYSLGATLYHLLSGQAPFGGLSVMQKLLAHQTRDPARIDQLCPDVPPELADVVARMMAKDSIDRFENFRDVIAALSPYCTGGAVAPFADELPLWPPRLAAELATQPSPVADDTLRDARLTTPVGGFPQTFTESESQLLAIPPRRSGRPWLFAGGSVATAVGLVWLAHAVSTTQNRPQTGAAAELPTMIAPSTQSVPRRVLDPDQLAYWDFADSPDPGKVLADRLHRVDLDVLPDTRIDRSTFPPTLELTTKQAGLVSTRMLNGGEVFLPRAGVGITAKVRVDSIGEWGGIVSCLQDNGNYERGFVLGTHKGRFTFGLATEGGGRMTYLEAATPFIAGKWYALAASYNGGPMLLSIRELPGGTEERVSSSAQSGQIIHSLSPPTFVAIGRYLDADENHGMIGAIREVTVLRRALTAKETEAALR